MAIRIFCGTFGATRLYKPQGGTDSHASVAERSESCNSMIAGGNHTMISCALARNDTKYDTLYNKHRTEISVR